MFGEKLERARVQREVVFGKSLCLERIYVQKARW